jgi:U3 small nucleolar RNA-associated protein 20
MMNLFGKFTNPNALHCTEILHSFYLSALPSRSLVTLPFTDVLVGIQVHPSSILRSTLNVFLDDAQWREALTALDMGRFQFQDRS